LRSDYLLLCLTLVTFIFFAVMKYFHFHITANGSPKIQVQTVFNVTVNEKSSLVVNVTDPDGDSVSLTLRTDLPSGANFDNVTGVFTWTPVDTTPVNITYVG